MKNFVLILGLAFMVLFAAATPVNDTGPDLTPFNTVVTVQGQPETVAVQPAAICNAPEVAFIYRGNPVLNCGQDITASGNQQPGAVYLYLNSLANRVNNSKPPAHTAAGVTQLNKRFIDRQNSNFGYPLTGENI